MEEQEKYEKTEHVEGQIHNQNRAMEELMALLKPVSDMILGGQKLQGEQALKQTEMQISAVSKFQTKLFSLAAFIIAIGAVALFMGKDNIGAQIIFSTMTFLAGIGFGIGLGRK